MKSMKSFGGLVFKAVFSPGSWPGMRNSSWVAGMWRGREPNVWEEASPCEPPYSKGFQSHLVLGDESRISPADPGAIPVGKSRVFFYSQEPSLPSQWEKSRFYPTALPCHPNGINPGFFSTARSHPCHPNGINPGFFLQPGAIPSIRMG